MVKYITIFSIHTNNKMQLGADIDYAQFDNTYFNWIPDWHVRNT